MKNHRVAIAAVLILMVSAVTSAGAVAQTGQDTEYYMIQGALQVLDRGYKTAVIDGLSWPLIDDFSDANIVSDLHIFGSIRTDLRRRPLVIRYYLVVQPASTPLESATLLKGKLPGVITAISSQDLKELNDRGAKLFKIYVAPM